MYEIAKLRYTEISGEDAAVDELLKSHLFVRANVNYQEKSSKFEDWFIELEKPSVTDYLNSQKSMLLLVLASPYMALM